MAKNKTSASSDSVTAFINSVDDETKRKDSFRIVEIMEKESGFEPKMWGPSIIGFGSYHYRYDSGHEGDAPIIGFSPRKAAISLYLYADFAERDKLLQQFGKHKTGRGCLYIKKLEDVSIEILKELVSLSIKTNRSKYPASK